MFFPIKGIIAIYDREAKKYYELPGASDKPYLFKALPKMAKVTSLPSILLMVNG